MSIRYGMAVFCFLMMAASINLFSQNRVPAKVNLDSPNNNSTNQDTSLTLDWSAALRATSYRLQVATNSSFSSLVMDQSSITTTFRLINGLSRNTRYYWRVRGINNAGQGNWSNDWNFRTKPFPPSQPVLSSPSNNSTGLNTDITFNWLSPGNTTSYKFQLSLNSSFTSLVRNDSLITSTSRQVTGLSNSVTYYWRVQAVNAGGSSSWSQIWNFTTQAIVINPPSAPLLSSPPNNSTDVDTSLGFVWFRTAGAVNYKFQLSLNNSFSSFIRNDSLLTDSTLSVNGLATNTTYFWRVQASNTGGESSFSQVWSFTTRSPGVTPPSPPLLSSPINNSTNVDTSLNFRWFRSAGAVNYKFQLSLNNTFSSFIRNDSLLTDSTRSVNGLATNTTYYWRVQASNTGGESSFSQVWSFTTRSQGVTPPSQPLLSSPLNNSADVDTSLTFRWFRSAGSVNYKFQLSLNNTFSSFIRNDSLLTDSTRSVNGLARNTTYYWRVQASNTGGTSSFSQVWSFTTKKAGAIIEGGYANKMSFAQGDSVHFFISTAVSPFTLSIYRSSTQQNLITSFSNIQGALQVVPDSSYWYGCRWNKTFSLVIPDNWLPGAYRAKFPVQGGTREIFFVVKERTPGSYSNILFVLNTNTWNAYNGFGGKSTYEFNSTNRIPSAKVSFLRPPDDPLGFEDFYDREEKFINWAAANNINLEYAVNYDVHVNPSLLSNYDVVITTGHSEYWSRPERLQFQNYLSNGGRVMMLSGNSVWWQVRFEDNGTTMVCYKEAPDPYAGVIDSLVTTNWYRPPVNYPENSFTGLSWRSGGYVKRNGFFAADGFGDYSAYNTHHWVYNGTGLTEGVEFGTQSQIVGVEVDGALYNWFNGIPTLTGADTSPRNYRVLGYSPALNVDNTTKQAFMGIYYRPGGGALFNAATMDWNYGLVNDAVVKRITDNVLRQFLSTFLPPEIVWWQPSLVQSAVINQQNVFLNKRDITIPFNTLTKFSIKAEDPNRPVTFLWRVNGNNAGTDSVYNFIITDNTQLFNITAYAFNGQDTASISWRVTRGGAIPNVPVLASPTNNATNVDTILTIRWFRSLNASTYKFQLSTDNSFNTFVRNDSLLTDSLRNFTGLSKSMKYFWRVRAVNQSGESAWSEVWSFTTQGVTQIIEGGYSDKMSVNRGDEIIFYISTSVSPFTLSFYKSENVQRFISSISSIAGSIQPVLDSSYHYGCRWQETYRFTIPTNWQPGAYRAKFPVTGGVREIVFFVKEPTPGAASKILFVASPNTWQAYNNFGGKSLYGYNSTNALAAYKVSFQRPPLDPAGFGLFYFKEEKFIKWSFSNGYTMEYATNFDVFSNPSLLSNYKVVIVAGHAEYWSRGERINFQNYIASGGKVIFLSGNTCWWQIRYEDNGKTLVCYKADTPDPLLGVTDSLVTVNWTSAPVNYPENIFTGTSFLHGGYVNFDNRLLAADGYGDYAAYNTHHWSYQGTNLTEGQEFGQSSTIVGHEVDGALFNWTNGIPVVTGALGTPLSYRITGLSPANLGGVIQHGTMGYFHSPNGGAVFNVATIDWVDGLETDAIVQRITKNVIDKYFANKFPPEIISWTPRVVKSVTINKENVFINERKIDMNLNQTLTFTLTTSDPHKQTVRYFWRVNGSPAGTDSFLTFTNNNTQVSTYNITAFAYNLVDTSSISWNVTNKDATPTVPQAPLTPVQAAPLNNSISAYINTYIKWMRTDRATSYALQVSTDSTFATTFFNNSSLTDTVQLVSQLQSNTKYFWRVRAANSDGQSNWSAVWNFTTIRFLLNAMDGTFTGDARLGTMTGSINTRVVYFQGTSGGVSFNVNIPVGGRRWYVWGRMYYNSSGGKNSFFVTVNGTKFVLGDDDTKYNQWHWDGNNGARIDAGVLNQGTQTILISGREPGLTLWIDQLILTDDANFLPEGFVLTNPDVPNNILLNAMNGTFTGDARLGTMSGSVNTRVVYFQGTNGGISFNVNIPVAGKTWYGWGRMYYNSSGGKNSFFINVNGGTKLILGDNDSKYNQWHWDGSNGLLLSLGVLNSGSNTVMVSGREPGLTLWIDQILLTDSPTFNPNSVLGKESIEAAAEVEIPSQFSVSQNFPNPFNPTTTIRYGVAENSRVTMKLFDILGNEVATLVDEIKEAGYYDYELDGSKLASGIYIYQVVMKNFIQNRKLILLK